MRASSSLPPSAVSPVSLLESLFQLPRFHRNYLEGLERLRQIKGDAFSLSFPKKTLFLMNPAHVTEVLVKNAKNFRKSDNYKASFGLLGDSLLTTEGEDWRRKRKVVAPEFHLSQISKFDSLFLKKINSQIDDWRGHKKIEAFSQMQRFSFEVAGVGFFGAETGEKAEQVMNSTQLITRIALKSLLFPWIKPNLKKVTSAMNHIEDVVADLVHEKRRQGSGCPVDLLKRLLDAGRVEDSQAMQMKEIRDQAVTVLLAGHETTTHALTWLLHLLLWNPEERSKLEARISSELGSHPPVGAQLDAVTSVDEAIDEALRLYPSVPVISRNSLEDQEVCGVPIQKGALVQLCPWVTHRHPDFWENPRKFDPSRFSPSRQSSRVAGSYFPFGAGPRECVGEHFARRQMKVAIIRVLQRCRLSPGARKPTLPRTVVLPHPHGPVWMNVEFK